MDNVTPLIGNLFTGVPEALPTEHFNDLLERPGCRIERIVSRGHATPPGRWYDQAWDEWVLLLKGAATLEIEGLERPLSLRPGDFLLLPAHCRHRVASTAADEDTFWLALHFSPAP